MSRIVASVCTLVVLAGCSNQWPVASGSEVTSPSATSYSLSPTAILMDFDEEDALLTSSPDRVGVESVLAGTANLILVQSGDGTSALRFPTWSGEVDAARLALVMRSKAGQDALTPHTRDFAYGADIRLDAKSTGPGEDNGDNVLQRGLFSDTSQYKLQVDKRVPSCRVTASGIDLFVKLPRAIDDGWFRVTCNRAGGNLTVTAHRVTLDGEEFFDQATVAGKVVDVNFSPETPVVVGGKVAATGQLVLKQSDQFNGELDNVFLDIDPSVR